MYQFEDEQITSKITNNQQTNNEQITNNQQQIKKDNKEKKDKIKEKNKKTFEDVFYENNFSKELEMTIRDFIDMRKTIKKPMTTKALELLLKNLERLTNSELEKIEILNQSIEHCWQTVYPLKQKNNTNIKAQLSKDTKKVNFEYNTIKYENWDDLYDN